MIGWYVHHQGSGHRTRAACIAPLVAQLTGEPVVGLSSLPRPAGFEQWEVLPPDDLGAALDPTAGGTLHWAPRRSPGVADRVAAIAGWLARTRPRALVVDVSVETALLARLAGIPTVVVALPGDRGDRPHQQAFAAADLVLAFWTREVYDPPWLHPHAARVSYVGAVSRYDGRTRPPGPRTGTVVLDGTGGSPLPDTGHPVLAVPDIWPAVCAAEVVISHAGQNALAELAAAGARTVVVPLPRPYAEQQRSAHALAAAGIVVTAPPPGAPVAPGAHTAPDWPDLVDRARTLDPRRWARWSDGNGAARAAGAIAAVAAR